MVNMQTKGYTLIILMFAVFVMSLGLMVAVPVWQTQIQREKEAELIFRGKQYVEAVRLYQRKKPGMFPKKLDDLLEEKCLRKPFPDPFSESGKWNVILLTSSPGTRRAPSRTKAGSTDPAVRRKRTSPGTRGGVAPQKVLIAPQQALSSIDNPRIVGVVSSSTRKSIKIYLQQDSYDKWLFYYGQDPNKLPEIVYYGQDEKD